MTDFCLAATTAHNLLPTELQSPLLPSRLTPGLQLNHNSEKAFQSKLLGS